MANDKNRFEKLEELNRVFHDHDINDIIDSWLDYSEGIVDEGEGDDAMHFYFDVLSHARTLRLKFVIARR